MSTSYHKTHRGGGLPKVERTFLYRGIKIAPIAGKRSKTATALREALKAKSGPARGRPAHA